jgi:hypothetical protein
MNCYLRSASIASSLTVDFEWNCHSTLLLCDENEIALSEVPEAEAY